MAGDPYRTNVRPDSDPDPLPPVPEVEHEIEQDVEEFDVCFKFKEEEIVYNCSGYFSPHPAKDVGDVIESPYAPQYYLADHVFDSYMKSSAKDGFFNFGNFRKPWHSFVRADIINRKSKVIKFVWIDTSTTFFRQS